MAVGAVGVYKAPTDMAANQQVLARVGPGTSSAAIVTGESADATLVNLRVFPDQQEDFSLRGIGLVDDPLMGSFVAAEPPTAPITTSRADERKRGG